MTFGEFIELSELEQLNIVIESFSIAIREEEGCSILLHKVDDFFVEVHYHQDESRLVSIKPIESTTNIINKIGKTIKVDTKLI